MLRWRRPSLEGLDGQRATLRGEVRVRKPVRVQMAGDCLWHRRVVRTHLYHGPKQSLSMKTVSDKSEVAQFSIILDGGECVVGDPPTHVYGSQYRISHSGDRSAHTYWLPVVDYLTVLGRVRRVGSRFEVVKDPKVGLVFSIHQPEHTALREVTRAAFGLAVVGAGLLVLYVLLDHLH
jgi:hypothetical protein